jgi:hypothetical protein
VDVHAGAWRQLAALRYPTDLIPSTTARSRVPHKLEAATTVRTLYFFAPPGAATSISGFSSSRLALGRQCFIVHEPVATRLPTCPSSRAALPQELQRTSQSYPRC